MANSQLWNRAGARVKPFVGLMLAVIFLVLEILKYMEVYEAVWWLFEVYEGIWRYIKVCECM